jgi:hypothetical protein
MEDLMRIGIAAFVLLLTLTSSLQSTSEHNPRECPAPAPPPGSVDFAAALSRLAKGRHEEASFFFWRALAACRTSGRVGKAVENQALWAESIRRGFPDQALRRLEDAFRMMREARLDYSERETADETEVDELSGIGRNLRVIYAAHVKDVLDKVEDLRSRGYRRFGFNDAALLMESLITLRSLNLPHLSPEERKRYEDAHFLVCSVLSHKQIDEARVKATLRYGTIGEPGITP